MINYIYILTQKVPRAETTDTSILLSSDDRSTIEETLLSIYQEAKEKHDDEVFLRQFINTFDIIKVPFEHTFLGIPSTI